MHTPLKNLRFYSFLSRFNLVRSYKLKIMLVAFLGTHVPLLTLFAFFIAANSLSFESTVKILIIALIATLVGTALTLLALDTLLAPVVQTSLALRNYLNQSALPKLPTHFTDEVGTLMADTVHTIRNLDDAIQYIVHYDNLTGLPNQLLFQKQLQQAIAQAERDNRSLAVMVLRLNNFENVRNALGSSVGELLLRNVVQRLSDAMPKHSVLAFLGSDVFGVMQPEITASHNVPGLAQDLLDTIAKPFSLNGSEVSTSASIGIAISSFDGVTDEQLLQNANTALKQAERQGHHYQFYSLEMNTLLQERLALENELGYALIRNELTVHYQPRFDTRTQRIVAVEALLRWQNPVRGLVSPATFIPIAEANGLILEMGEWVLKTACQQSQIWRSAGLPPIRMAVNLSARQFEQPDLVERIAQILAQTGVEASCLELEVTEGLMMKNVTHSIASLQQLHDLGISIALDDFGTGYSSLNYLSRFPIDTLKIDQSFMRNIVTNPDDVVITKAIIALATSLQLNITAEGVETKEQFEFVEAHGCDEVQGYYFSRPVTADVLTQLLESNYFPESHLSAAVQTRNLIPD
ncbi:EAL domain-containing protein [Oculatella sp. LEGE 06141]|nr:EAL domain-containing protein [Oculatella sp. LEGE 06141]